MHQKGLRVAVCGATGMVGRTMLNVLEERRFPIAELILVGSQRSAGQLIGFNGTDHTVVSLDEALIRKPDLALFSAGGEVSLQWAPRFAAKGCTVIDNSSAWRMSAEHRLIVPEVNGGTLTPDDLIIANPNCSTIQLVMVLKPLHDRYGVRRVVVSTYQSVTGTGADAVAQLDRERRGESGPMVYPYPIDRNCIPHCDVFLENDYTKEEMKLTQETVKILSDDRVRVSATAVRVPVVGGHAESVNIEFEQPFEVGEVRQLLQAFPGVTLADRPDLATYPMPLFAAGKDDVFVGRIRRDESHPSALNVWIVADNLRKGAATNAVQIAELLLAQQRWG